MKPEDQITAEMLSICPWLAEKGRQSLPYNIPVGYFESFPEMMLLLVKGKENQEFLPGNPEVSFNRQDSREEMEGLSPLLSRMTRKTPFSTPEGYFEQLVVPDATGDQEFSPVLTRLNPYTVPEGYFDALPEKMLAAVASPRKSPTRVVPMGRKILRYSAAAAITGLVALGGWYLNSTRPHSMSNSDTGSQQNLTLQLEKELNQLGDDAFADYSFLPPAGEMPSAALANNDDDLNANDIHFLLEDVSDKSLQEFLADEPGKTALPSNN